MVYMETVKPGICDSHKRRNTVELLITTTLLHDIFATLRFIASYTGIKQIFYTNARMKSRKLSD